MRLLMARTVAALVAAVVGTGAAVGPWAVPAGAAAARAGAARSAPVLSWHSCDKRFRCAELAVPISYLRPGRGTLDLSVVMLPASGKHPVGDLVTNPGGPGGSGVDFLEQAWSSFPASLRASFNLVSFDPRGVDRSDPVVCASAAETRHLLALDPAPTTPAEIATVVTAVKGYVADCKAHTSHLLLANVGTRTTVLDLDRLRAALGEPKLDYLGLSYGTYIGELYAERFPSKVRAMILDGAVDPALSTQTSDLQQALGFETDLNDFLAWCDKNATCHSGLPDGARKDYNRLFDSFTAGHSIVANFQPLFGGRQPVGLGVAEIGVVSALYSKQDWPTLAQALSTGLRGNGDLLAELAYNYAGLQADGTFSNIDDANTAINCVDRPSPTTIAEYQALARQLAAKAPDFGASEAWGTLACAYWPVPPAGPPAAIHAPGSPPILVVGSTGDPATPYAWAQAVASQLDHAVLLTRAGSGHTGYFSSACVRSWADGYLTSLTLPPKGTICPSN
ncbi:MAG TPA: alpha/beta hydrolase [Acidimicrobiales bacterium]|nr:alpha/beta hydrolase [Acidimicrobiales bacterium]